MIFDISRPDEDEIKDMLEEALAKHEALETENTALTTQLEDLKGKLVMIKDAFSKPHDRATCFKWNNDQTLGLMIDDAAPCTCFQQKALQALSPDIQRYREEIEREARKGYLHIDRIETVIRSGIDEENKSINPYVLILALKTLLTYGKEDPHFKQVVDLFYSFMTTSQFTLHELRQALTYAAIRYEMHHVRPMFENRKELPE